MNYTLLPPLVISVTALLVGEKLPPEAEIDVSDQLNIMQHYILCLPVSG